MKTDLPGDDPGDSSSSSSDSDDSSNSQDSVNTKQRKRRKRKKRQKAERKMLRDIKMKTVMTEQIKTQVKLTVENIKNNLTVHFDGYPNSSNTEAAIESTSNKAIAFIIAVIHGL